jgi:hypothetical protein
MTYKNKITVLSGIIGALVLIYILTIVFDPQRRRVRTDAYSWLESGHINLISGITITNPGSAGEPLILSRNGGTWFVTRGGKDYPARQVRIDDFIAALTLRAPYPVRSSNASSHERLSLTEDRAVRVTVSGGAGLPLLTLLIGQVDITGQNVYLRMQGHNEVRSGEDRFTSFIGSTLTAWYNLKLFPESEEGKLSAADVQRFTVYPPEVPPQVFTRRGREWTFNFELVNPDMGQVDSYLREIINASGSDFAEDTHGSDPMFNSGRIVLEFGDGSIKNIRFSPPDEDGQKYAVISGTDWVYVIPSWTASRFFPETDYFEG